MSGGGIYLRVNSGLCNRWRALLSAMAVADSTGRQLYLDWRPDLWCRAAPEDLWELPSWVTLAPAEHWPAGPSLVFRKREHKRFGGKQVWDAARDTNQDIKIFANFAFANALAMQAENQKLPLKPVWQEAVDQFYAAKMANRRGVSVCVRWKVSTSKSRRTKPRWFRERMQEELMENPDTYFYLVVDSADLKAEFAYEFEDRILEFPKTTYANGHPAVATQSLCDVYLMAKTKLLFGGLGSSFVRMPVILNRGIRWESHRGVEFDGSGKDRGK